MALFTPWCTLPYSSEYSDVYPKTKQTNNQPHQELKDQMRNKKWSDEASHLHRVEKRFKSWQIHVWKNSCSLKTILWYSHVGRDIWLWLFCKLMGNWISSPTPQKKYSEKRMGMVSFGQVMALNKSNWHLRMACQNLYRCPCVTSLLKYSLVGLYSFSWALGGGIEI